MTLERVPIIGQDEFRKLIAGIKTGDIKSKFYLPHELGFVDNYFQRMVKNQAIHGAHLGDAMGQSSETYHDNAPAEAVVSDQEVLVNAVKLLRVDVNNGTVVDYPAADTDYATLGSVCLLDFGGEEEVCLLAGEPNGYRGLEFDFSFTPVSIFSPVGRAVLGLPAASEAEANADGNTIPIRILEIEQTGWPIHATFNVAQ